MCKAMVEPSGKPGVGGNKIINYAGRVIGWLGVRLGSWASAYVWDV